MEERKNLWPAFEASKISLPKSLMVEQASFLTEITKKHIIGDVRTGKTSDGKVSHTFRIVAPALDNYMYSLFRINQDPVILYPFDLIWAGRIFAVAEEARFLELMGQIFNDDQTKRVISSILAQVNAEDNNPNKELGL